MMSVVSAYGIYNMHMYREISTSSAYKQKRSKDEKVEKE